MKQFISEMQQELVDRLTRMETELLQRVLAIHFKNDNFTEGDLRRVSVGYENNDFHKKRTTIKVDGITIGSIAYEMDFEKMTISAEFIPTSSPQH